MQNTNTFHILKESLNALCKIASLFNQSKKETEEANIEQFNQYVERVNQCFPLVFRYQVSIPNVESPTEMVNTLDFINNVLLSCITTPISESVNFVKKEESFLRGCQSDEAIKQKMQELFQMIQNIILINNVGPNIISIYESIKTAKGEELRRDCDQVARLLYALDQSNITTVTLQFGEDIIDLPLQIRGIGSIDNKPNNADQKIVQKDERRIPQMNYDQDSKQRTLLEIREEYQKIKLKNTEMKKDLEIIKQNNQKTAKEINDGLCKMREMQQNKIKEMQQMITQLRMKSQNDEETIDNLTKENQRLKNYIEQTPINQKSQETSTKELPPLNKESSSANGIDDIPIEPEIISVDIPIHHYFTGYQEEIEINGQIFTVPITVGLSDGAEFNYKGYGKPVNGRKRDLIIVAKTQQTESYQRQENNLFQTVAIPQAYRNQMFQCSIPCIDGDTIPVMITGQEGVQGPYEGYGMPIGTTGKRGDLYLIIKFN
ncbi:hypothetical protein EDI_053840 [Entamoeba dispar SAW760]|uniref:Chaperone DnaJ C-terminal domain-containing protein n=1 Tax=Entamoeba dispar (strain ATCC PRA-260 / SAW760) TaxID=370354 RepID=B0E8V3_ENTDS|nr:uncharacterized protein EDI_053840 [Entamoeba dispar SAW760]EDR29041.1 hypothetical protein EDI_053840 [Entamoeba dispar SAW760]|eukprot:EDR29041.1 hypothetical protein EDI_053840 [Entamoeba dispar SAW760]